MGQIVGFQVSRLDITLLCCGKKLCTIERGLWGEKSQFFLLCKDFFCIFALLLNVPIRRQEVT